jgi:poly(U)-binding-splicing factor PUF60
LNEKNTNQIQLNEPITIQQTMVPISIPIQPSTPQSSTTKIYVGNINYEITEENLYRTFSALGTIKKVKLMKDTALGRHKGFGFVEYTTPESAELALHQMQGFILGGRSIKVGRPVHSGTNPVNPQMAAMMQNLLGIVPVPTPHPKSPSQIKIPATKLLISNVDINYNENDLSILFSMFGQIKSINLVRDPETGKHKEYGFIEYQNEHMAQEAIEKMNGYQLGRNILSVAPAAEYATHFIQSCIFEDVSIRGMEERMELTRKLQMRENIPSPCIVLMNMAGPDEDFSVLETEVITECGKFGHVIRVKIVQNESDVNVYVLFDSIESANAAKAVLDKRWYGGKLVTARYADIGKCQ